MKQLTKKQSKVLEFIRKFISENSYSPAYKEIADAFGNNVNAIQQVIHALIKKGCLEKSAGIARGIRIKENPPAELAGAADMMRANIMTIPLYGNVAAGEPIFADNNIQGYLSLEKPHRSSGMMFAVTVQGDSMVDKKIIEKDKLIVRKQDTAEDGEVVVALLDDEVTVKIFRKNGGKPYLQPANNMYDPIRRPFTILGIVVGLNRDYTAR